MSGNSIGARPNKYWPIVAGVVAISLFSFLTITNQKHSTQSGDNIHKFANGGQYQDGSKKINYNKNNSLAYDGSSSNSTLTRLLLPMLCAAGGLYLYLWFTRHKCSSTTCRGECAAS